MVFADFAELISHAEQRIDDGEPKQVVYDDLAPAIAGDPVKHRLFAERIAAILPPDAPEDRIRRRSMFLAALLFLLSSGSFAVGLAYGLELLLFASILLFALFSAMFLDARNGRWLDATRRCAWLLVGLGTLSLPYEPLLAPFILLCALLALMSGVVLRSHYAPHGWVSWLRRDARGRYVVAPARLDHAPA